MASVVRVFVILNVETAPQSNNGGTSSTSNSSSNSNKKKLSSCHPLVKCSKVFTKLLPLAVWELSSAAAAVLLPVRLNSVKPTSVFGLSPPHLDHWNGAEDLFQVGNIPGYANFNYYNSLTHFKY